MEKLVGVLLGQRQRVDAAVEAALDDLVVNVGDVLDVVDVVAGVLEVAAQHVEDHVTHGVADVSVGVGGDAADVHLHGVSLGLELILAAGEGAVEPHWASWMRQTAEAAIPSWRPMKPSPSVVVALMLTC